MRAQGYYNPIAIEEEEWQGVMHELRQQPKEGRDYFDKSGRFFLTKCRERERQATSVMCQCCNVTGYQIKSY